jgi:gluconate 5-dehydrogenase
MAVLDQFRLEGRRALVTGGSRGLGRAIAQGLAEAGAGLVLVARGKDSLEAAAAELRLLGGRVDVLAADLADGASAERMCAEALAHLGPIDILVNNVGGRREDLALEDTSLADWQRLMALNLESAAVCAQRLAGPMLQRGWGRVINIASIAGPLVAMRGIRGRHYEAAKAALAGFTRAAAADWAPRGVTVNAICPGGFLTEPNLRWFRERPQFQADFERNIPMGRLGNPPEIAPLALYLASEASRYMTGALLVLDGGYTLW